MFRQPTVTSNRDRMVLIRFQIVPLSPDEEILHETKLNSSRSVDLAIPAFLKAPSIATPVNLPGRSTKHRPIFLSPQRFWRTVATPFELIARLDHKDRFECGTVILSQDLSEGGKISVGGIEIDSEAQPGSSSEPLVK